MLKRDGWQALQEAQRAASKPSAEDWKRLFARLAKEVASLDEIPRDKKDC
jgi:hypothetical protein